jgi:hypothetical protein
MSQLRKVLISLPGNNNEVHPMAKEGTLHDFIRASDKSFGDSVQTYAQKGELFYVKTPIGSNERRILAKRLQRNGR